MSQECIGKFEEGKFKGDINCRTLCNQRYNCLLVIDLSYEV